MPLTVTQARILNAHLDSLSHSLMNRGKTSKAQPFTLPEIFSSLVYELGPFLCPMTASGIECTSIDLTSFSDEKLLKISGLINSANEELQSSIDTCIPPGNSFREIIAKLLEELGPLIIQIIISLLLDKEVQPQR